MTVLPIKQDLAYWQKMVKPYQQPDLPKATIQILSSFLPFFGIWALMYYTLNWSYILTLGLAFFNAFFLLRIFIIQHDCGHQAFFKSKKSNLILGELCSFFTLIPYRYWSRSHNFHHGHNGMLEQRGIGDITMLTVKEYTALSRWGKLGYRVYRSIPVMFFVIPLVYLLLHVRIPTIRLKGWQKARRSLIWSNLSLFAFYALLTWALGWPTLLSIQLPIIIFFAMIAFWFFYVQHQHESNYKQWKDNWDHLLAAFKGSSYYVLPRPINWLTGNIGYHHIHHLNSLIPAYNLQKCHQENPIFEKHAVKMNFRDSLKTISNKLWDEDAQRMITFEEYRKGIKV